MGLYTEKLMINSTSNTSASVTMDDERLEEIFCFKYFGEILSKDGTRDAEILTRTATPTATPSVPAAKARLEIIWKLPDKIQALRIA